MKLKKSLLPLVLLLVTHYASAQTIKDFYNIYYATNAYSLPAKEQPHLDSLIQIAQTQCLSYNIVLRGFTDNVGNQEANLTLSQKRAQGIADYLQTKGIKSENVKTAFFGEDAPVNTNASEAEKRLNRRVEVSFECIVAAPKKPTRTPPVVKPVVPDTILTPISELYKKINPEPQRFCINPNRDTVLRGQNGTIVYIRKNTFAVSTRKAKKKCLTIKLKEAFSYSDMLANNLATQTTDGKLLETQGMVFVDAEMDGKPVKLNKKASYDVFVPTDTLMENAKIFSGRTSEKGTTNWAATDESVMMSIPWETFDLDLCGSSLGRYVSGPGCKKLYWYDGSISCIFLYGCPYKCLKKCFCCAKSKFWQFFCFRWLRKKKWKKERITLKNSSSGNLVQTTTPNTPVITPPNSLASATPNPSPNVPPVIANQLAPGDSILNQYALKPGASPECQRLVEYLNNGHIDFEALENKINEPILKKYGVKNYYELADSVKSQNIKRIQAAFNKRRISFEDLKYYSYRTTTLGWKNVDVFADIPANLLTKISINQVNKINIDCKLVIKTRKFVLSSQAKEGQKYYYSSVPKDEKGILVLLKYFEGIPYLSMQNIVIEENMKITPEFRPMKDVNELLEELKKLDFDQE